MDRCETTGFRDHRYRPCRLDYFLSARCNGAGDHLEVHCKTCPALASSTAWCCRSATVAASSRPKPSRSRSTLSEIHTSMHTSTPHPHIPTSAHPHIHMYKRSSAGAMLRGRSSAQGSIFGEQACENDPDACPIFCRVATEATRLEV